MSAFKAVANSSHWRRVHHFDNADSAHHAAMFERFGGASAHVEDASGNRVDHGWEAAHNRWHWQRQHNPPHEQPGFQHSDKVRVDQ